jgi:hypothetical protein
VQAEDIASAPRLMRRLGRDDPSRALRHHLRQPGRNRETSWPQESRIWAVAPYLDPELARDALQIAPGEPHYARCVWLAALAPRLPRDLRPAVVREALSLLDVAPHTYAVRLRILARIAEADPTEAVTDACRTAAADLVRIAANADELDARADFLAHLPDGAVDVALDASARRLYLVDRCRILTPLVPRLPTALIAGLVADLEAADREWGADETERERALVVLACRTQDAGERDRILTGLLDGMTRRRSWYVHGPALLDMIPQASAGIRASAVALALPSCFNGHDGRDPATLVELLDGDELLTALDQARHIEDRARQGRRDRGGAAPHPGPVRASAATRGHRPAHHLAARRHPCPTVHPDRRIGEVDPLRGRQCRSDGDGRGRAQDRPMVEMTGSAGRREPRESQQRHVHGLHRAIASDVLVGLLA